MLELRSEASGTSSIGAAWPPAPGSHERLRGFYTEGVVETASECAAFAEVIRDQEAQFIAQQEYTRLSIRAVMRAAHLSRLERSGVRVEAAIPLTGTTQGMVLAYAAVNKGQRIVPNDMLRAHGRLLESIVADREIDPRSRADMLQTEGYVPHSIDSSTGASERAALEGHFLEMYEMFGYGAEGVRELLHNPANTIAFVRDDQGNVVSTAMAERADVLVRGFGALSLIEITEAATRPDYRQRGLYKAVSGVLVERLVLQQPDDPVHAIYGESNMAMPGVLIAGHENGRRFSYFDRSAFGVGNVGFGILQQNFRVEDGQEKRRYNDFAVSYVSL